MAQKEHIIKTYQRTDVVDSFDEEREMYSYQRYKHKLESQILLRAINPKKTIKILDVACGTGRLIPEIFKKSKNVEYYGLDTSKEMMSWLKKKAERLGVKNKIKLVVGDASKMPFKDKTFDVVFSYHLLWHLPFEEQKKIISEMLRVAKSNGIIVMDAINKNFIWEKIRNLFGVRSKEIYKVSVSEIKNEIKGNRIIKKEKLLDIHVNNSFFYSFFHVFNKIRKILHINFFHMIYFVIRKT